MRLLVLLLIVSGAAAQNTTDEPGGEPTDPTNGTDTGDTSTRTGEDAWWAQRNVQWSLSGVAVAGLVGMFVAVARR